MGSTTVVVLGADDDSTRVTSSSPVIVSVLFKRGSNALVVTPNSGTSMFTGATADAFSWSSIGRVGLSTVKDEAATGNGHVGGQW